jgi:hypothetical protein
VVRVGQTTFNFSPYIQLYIFNQQQLSADGILIPNLHKALLVGCNTYFMRKLILVTLSFMLTYFATGQSLQLDIQTKKLQDFIKLEDSLGSKKIKSESEYMSEPGVAQPEIYKRKELKVPDMLSYYFYYEKDSSIDYILYEWDESNFTGFKEGSKKTDSEVANFIEKYNQICSEITNKYGKSQSTGDLLNISKVEEGMTREDNWQPDGNTKIQLYTTLSSKYEKKEPFTTNPTYRIRLYVRNIKTAM